MQQLELASANGEPPTIAAESAARPEAHRQSQREFFRQHIPNANGTITAAARGRPATVRAQGQRFCVRVRTKGGEAIGERVIEDKDSVALVVKGGEAPGVRREGHSVPLCAWMEHTDRRWR